MYRKWQFLLKDIYIIISVHPNDVLSCLGLSFYLDFSIWWLVMLSSQASDLYGQI